VPQTLPSAMEMRGNVQWNSTLPCITKDNSTGWCTCTVCLGALRTTSCMLFEWSEIAATFVMQCEFPPYNNTVLCMTLRSKQQSRSSLRAVIFHGVVYLYSVKPNMFPVGYLHEFSVCRYLQQIRYCIQNNSKKPDRAGNLARACKRHSPLNPSKRTAGDTCPGTDWSFWHV
jgi:hypothetical protein